MSEVKTLIRDGLKWPFIGWYVKEVAGAEQCQDIEYGTKQHIPAPIGMRVPITATADDLLFGRRTFSKILNEDTYTIQTLELSASFPA